MKPGMSALVTTLVLALSAPAHANSFEKFFRPSSGEAERAVQAKSAPEVYSTQNVEADIDRLLEDGNLILGLSSFVGPIEDTKKAKKFGKKLKASLVLIQYQYLDKVSGGTQVVMMPLIGGGGGLIGRANEVFFERYSQTAYFIAR